MGRKTRIKSCLKCGHQVVLKKAFFLCETCRKANAHLEDLGVLHKSYLSHALRAFRLAQHG